MARIIRQSYIEESVDFLLSFDLIGHEGSGYSFPCDEAGVVAEGELYPAGLENLAECRATIGTRVHAPEILRREHRFRHAAVLACDCGREVTLCSFTNACDCGRDYNSSGSLLAPRAQWGEETGESLGDILRIP